MQTNTNTTSERFEHLDNDAPNVERIRRPAKRPGKLVAAFGHSTALRCSPALARRIAGVA